MAYIKIISENGGDTRLNKVSATLMSHEGESGLRIVLSFNLIYCRRNFFGAGLDDHEQKSAAKPSPHPHLPLFFFF